jgi:hypothetical protein
MKEKKIFLPLFLALLLTGFQLVRVIAFANIYGGLEHDSGWFLGVSRSLAEQGTYTAMVSTIEDPAALGALNVDQKFDIQAADGRIWFFTGNGTGPASIVPNMMVIKLFGTDFWTLRAGPLLFYTLCLLTTSYALYRLAGLGALVLFHGFLFCYPRLSIFLSYEAEGEVAAMFYTVLAYLIFAWAVQKSSRQVLYSCLAGVVAGLAVNTKLLALLSISGIFIWAGWLWLASRGLSRFWGNQRKAVLSSFSSSEWEESSNLRLGELLALGGGLVLPLALWEAIQFIVLIQLTNFDLYLRHVEQRIRFVLDDGSGLGLRVHSGSEFIWRKFFMLQEVTHPEHWVTLVVFVCLLLGGLIVLWLWRDQPYRQNLLAPVWLGWLVNTIWFVSLAKTGWPRHFWFGLILAVMLLSVIPPALLQAARLEASQARRYGLALGGALLLVLLAWGAGSQPHVWGFFLPDEIVPYWLERRFDYVDMSGLPWILIPRAQQAEVVDYISHMPPEANVYYPTAEFGHKAAEIPVLTGRINYPFKRRSYPGVTRHPADILLIPPSILSPWRFAPVTRQELLQQVKQACPQPVLENESYIICLAEELQLPQ